MDINKANTKSSRSKWTKIIVIDFIILVLIICIFSIFKPFSHSGIKINGIYIANPKDIPDFNLIDHHGHVFTKAQLKGHWTFMFFGFTHCPMICPGTLDALNKMYVDLQKQLPPELLPQVVFVTIDPERDTVTRLNQYINTYNPHFIGARADLDKTEIMEKNFSITVSGNNGNFAHDTDIILLNKDAKIQAYFTYPHHGESMASDYVKIVGWVERFSAQPNDRLVGLR